MRKAILISLVCMSVGLYSMEENPLSFSTSDVDFLFYKSSKKQKRRSTGDCDLHHCYDGVFSSNKNNPWNPKRAEQKIVKQKQAAKIVLINGVYYQS